MVASGKTDLPRGCMLILLGVAIGIALPLLVYIFDFPAHYLRQLPALPSPAGHLLGIAAGDDYYAWYTAVVYVATADDANYRWAEDDFFREPDVSQFTWVAADTLPVEWHHIPCAARDVAKIEREAGPIGECLAVQLSGEWCPPPRVSFALDGAGGVWLLSQEFRCPLFTITIPLLVTAPGGFVLGVVLAAGDEVIRRLRRRRRSATDDGRRTTHHRPPTTGHGQRLLP